MRRYLVLVGILAALVIPATALAVSLNDSQIGTTCPYGGTFHFVANGVAGQVGTLTATFSVDGSVTDQAADKHNQGTNQWWVDGVGTLTGATATVGDHLVLSDYTCFQKK